MAHIVVVDDEPDLRDMVREYLLKHGYSVSERTGPKRSGPFCPSAPWT
jgi:DNA-binding response OmpR family regulator